MIPFKQFIKESIDATAGVSFGVGDNAESYRFKVSDLIAHAQQQNEKGEDIYPVQHLDPNSMADNIEARRGSESKEDERRRTDKADIRYPIIATHRPDGRPHVLDGTHRLDKAIKGNHKTIPVRIVPREHLKKFKV